MSIRAARAGPGGEVILLEWEGGRVERIRDFRYVPYIIEEAELELM